GAVPGDADIRAGDAEVGRRLRRQPGLSERGLRVQPEAWSVIRYAAERLALGVLVVVGVVVLTFLIARVIPGDPAVTYAGPRASKAQLEQTRRQLGLNQPVIEQLGNYLKGIASGDWGTSYRTKRPVLSDLRTALPAS